MILSDTHQAREVKAAPPPPLSHWLRDAARRNPSACAVLSSGAQLTYAQLLEATESIASRLRDKGFEPGDRIGIAAIRSIDTVVAILAVIDAGLGYVPLDLNYPPDRLQAMLEDAGPRIVLGEADALTQLRTAVGTFPTLEHPAPPREMPHAAAADLAYVLFTSGSTGRPKGVAMGAMPLRHLIHWHALHARLGKAARVLQFAPLSFDVHFQEIFSTLACCGTLVLVPEAQRRDPALLLGALVEHRIERIFVPYVALQMIADAARDRAPAELRDVISAGEQLQVTPAIRSMFVRLPGAELHNHYGPTESHVVTAHELRGDPSAWPEIPPIGLPLPHVRLALLNAQSESDSGGTTGELLLGGDTLAHGYLGRSELTAERFRSDFEGLPGCWYITGDLVRRDAEGVCTYLGRADQQLKVDGFRIEPGEIELAMMGHDAIKDAVVTAPDLPGVGKQLVAHIVMRDGAATDVSALIAQLRVHLRGCLPEYMVPVRFVTLERLPTTPSGKIDRKALPLPALESTAPASTDPLVVTRALWQELLGLPQIGDEQNLFELGARSLLVMRFVTRLKDLGIKGVSVADVYDRPTVAGIAAAMGGQPQARKKRRSAPIQATAGIAIVGMASRTPGAADLETFWQNLLAGREGIRHFALNEVDPSVPESVRSRPNFVAAHGVLDDVERFDAAFFGISAREATMLDPQQRLMLEMCASALEHAAIDPSRTDARIGVFAGTGNNAYALALRQEQPELIQQYGEFATMLASEKDYVATRVANRLNLNGPALSIHTACSTSLVAVAQAWHALASGQCDVALAGGANVMVPQINGYLHVEGGMESADGHCRPFDAEASGTVFASGGGVVVLRRLEDALAAGDTIYAVIRGVGLNNDGGDKASFTAPSVTGQAGAVRMALEHAQLSARSIGYVEAHGTGTSLGDPIEVAALTRAWREDTDDSEFCGIGSVKSNIGHMAAGAGVVGLIKAALSLHCEVIPGTLHFRQPNPQIDFTSTPFKVVARNTPWPRAGEARRAAVSSFGVGGTNAHVVIEEAPARHATEADTRRFVLPLSARTAEATLQRARDLADHLERHPELALAEVAATLMRGRKPMVQRLSVVASSVADAVSALRATKSSVLALHKPRLVFLFPGQGSQHPGMARRLYDEAPAFRETLDQCLDIANKALGVDLHAWLVSADPSDAAVAQSLAETRYAQPALFSVSYALAVWLDSVGLHADAMIGHSIGEYAAACHAGVFSLGDAMTAVLARGQAMFDQPRGAMLAVRTGADMLQPLLPIGVEIAGCNAPALTVVAGSHDAIDAFAKQLEALDIGTTRLRVSHAFHTAAMDGALPLVARALQRASLKVPNSVVYSCISGAPLKNSEATDPHYWARQVRAPVQFNRAVAAELTHGDAVFVEVGPGQALTALVRQHRTPQGAVPRNVPLLGTAADPGDPAQQVLTALGALWCAGVDVAWPVAASAQRLPLPTYPFKGERYWFARRTAAVATQAVNAMAAALPVPIEPSIAIQPSETVVTMSRIPNIESELKRVLSDVSGLPADEMTTEATFVDQGLDSLSLTQATLELERVFGVKLRFRRLLEDLDNIGKLARLLDVEMPADKFAPPAAPVVVPVVAAVAAPAATMPAVTHAVPVAVSQYMPAPAMPPLTAGANAVHQLLQQQMQLMAQQLAVLAGQPLEAVQMLAAGQPPAATAQAVVAADAPARIAQATAKSTSSASSDPTQPSIKSLVEKPFGASPRLTLEAKQDFTPVQRRWLDDFIGRYNARSGKSKAFSQLHRKVMADPRVVTGFNPLWKDLVYPIVVDRSSGASLWDLDGNEYIDLLSCFGGNLLGYQPPGVIAAMHKQLQLGLEVGPQHPLAADVAHLISEFTGMERVGFCNTGSEAVMGAMRIARTVTGRKTIAIFTNSYHGIFDEVIVRGTKQLRSLSAAPGILANAVENILVLDWNSEDSLRVLRERGTELAAIMTEPIQNKYPTLQPREFVQALRQIADKVGCALIFDEVVTGFRVAPGGAQEFYGVRADIATYGKVIGGGLPFAAIAGNSNWLDALDGGHWQYGDDSYPEAGVTYFAGTFVRHPIALAAAHATLMHLKKGGSEFYRKLSDRTQRMIERLNAAFVVRGAPVKAVHCASLWRLQWDDNQKFISLFYYLLRFHGLHVYEQFGHFVTEGMTDAHTDRIFQVFTNSLDELMGLGLISPRDGAPPPGEPRLTGNRASAPLTPGQTERWLAANFDLDARRALNESLCLTLTGKIDLASMEAALTDVLGQHEAFRIRFDAEEPQQVLDPAARPTVRRIDLRAEVDSNEALDRFCRQASLSDFAIDTAPLAQVSLLSLPDGRTVVHLVASHLVFDGWASPVFLADLAIAYRARSVGLIPPLAAAESPRQFARDEQARWEGPQGKECLAFWKSALASPPTPLTLGDRHPPSLRKYSGDTLRINIDGDLFLRTQKLARQASSTMFQCLLAVVSMAIHRRTGREDFVVCIPYASQNLQRHGPLIGDGVLDLPLRLSVRPDIAFAEHLADVRNRLLDAIEHPLATQGSVARALGVTSIGSRPPLTGVYFNLNPRLDVRGFEPLQARVHEGRKLGLLSEVIFNFYETPDALMLDLHHSTEFFSPQGAADLAANFRDVLEEVTGVANITAQPTTGEVAGAPRNSQALLSPNDRARLTRWNDTDTAYETGLRLGDLIRRTVARHPQAVAVRFEGSDVTYAELDRMAWAIAHRLRASGVRSGDLVGVCLDRSVELVVALVGVVYSGGAYVPLDPAYPAERLANMFEDARMRVLVTRDLELARTRAALPAPIEIVTLDPELLGQAAQPGSLLGTSEDAAYVIFTSGSTGRPKGAMNAHKGIVNRLQWMQQEYQLAPHDRVMQKTPYSFDVSVWEFFWPLMTGATIVVARPEGHRDVDYLADLIESERITVLHFVPSMLRLFLEDVRSEQCRSVRQVICSGEALPIDAVDRFFQTLPRARLGNLYGPTEAAVDVTYWNCVLDDPRRLVPIGRPIANTRMYVLGDELQLLPPGQEGELYIGGIQVGMGYVSRPDLTRERFLPDPFNPGGRLYKTGDIGRWLGDGAIEYLGRADHQVKIRGNRIELGEIELSLGSHSNIARCVVIAREDKPGDLRLVAYCVAAGAVPGNVELQSHLRAALPDYMVPQHFVWIDAIPLLPNGKLDRKALPELGDAGMAASREVRAPSTAMELALSALWCELLRVERVGADDNFIALGGHSLLLMRMATQVKNRLGLALPVRDYFIAPSLAALARRLETLTAPAAPHGRILARAEQECAPLSLMQERLWFMESLHPGRLVYHIEGGLRLRGRLNAVALDRAAQTLLARQAALRTVFEQASDNSVSQRALPVYRLPLLPAQDLSAMPSDQIEASLMDRIADIANCPFQLHGQPLFRLHLFKLSENEHVLFMLAHHLIFDGWSMTVLVRELSELYRAESGQEAARLPTLSVSYGDFAAWQQTWARGPAARAQVSHWCQKLSSLGEPLALPTDHPRPPEPSNQAGAVHWRLDASSTEALKALGQSEDATLFMVVLAGYYTLLHRHTGQTDFVVGFPVRGRNDSELEDLVGYFANVLPLRLSVYPEQTFRSVLRDTRHAVLEALDHADAPFEQVVRELKLPRDESRFPVYQTLFAYQDTREVTKAWGELQTRALTETVDAVAEDLAVWMTEANDGLAAKFAFAADLFDGASIEYLAQRFGRLLQSATLAPDCCIDELLMQSPSEASCLRDWNATVAVHDEAATLGTLLPARMREHLARPAVVFGDQSWSMAELQSHANRLAHLLRSRGVGRGSLVGLCLERSPRMLAAQLGVIWSGAAYVPLDPTYPIARLTHMADDAKLALALTDEASRSRLDWCPELTLDLDQLAGSIAALPDTPLPHDPARAARASDPAYVIYTSGSTGKPKGVSVPHGAVVNFLTSMADRPGMTQGDRILAVTTISFDIAVLELLLPLTVGASIVLATREQVMDGAALRELIEKHQVTMMQATPSTWRMLLSAGWLGTAGFKALTGGEALAADLAKQLQSRCAELWNMYGPTETTVWSSCALIEADAPSISIGTPIANTQIHVLDAQQRICPIGVPGEIYIAGTGVALGYLNRPELTAERFVANPFAASDGERMYRTGDLGRWLNRGVLEHLGRLDHQVKVRGHRIELGEIESALEANFALAGCVVVVREDSPSDPRIVAYLVAMSEPLTTVQLRERLRQALPEYMVPQHFVWLDALPLLPNGKINRADLPAPEARDTTSTTVDLAPHTAEERAIAEIWGRLLGVSGITPSDNFFDLGGHSLLAMQALAEMQHLLGRRFELREMIFESLASIAAAEHVDSTSVQPAKPSASLASRLIASFKSTLGAR